LGYEDLNEKIETGDLFWGGHRLFLLLRSNIGAFFSNGGFIIGLGIKTSVRWNWEWGGLDTGYKDVSEVELGVWRS